MVRIELIINKELLDKLIENCDKYNILNLNEEIIYFIEEGMKAVTGEDDDEEEDNETIIKVVDIKGKENLRYVRPDIFKDVM